MRKARRVNAQSAMEYLMTYGWAILIIAVVLGALYSLGVFNAVNFMPKVPGGGCHVFRPNGPGTSWNVNLVGSCNNALPQYVAQFNGQSSYINAGAGSSLTMVKALTVSVWVRFSSFTNSNYDPLVARGMRVPWYMGQYAYGRAHVSLTWQDGGYNDQHPANILNLNTWYQIAFVYDYQTATLVVYENGQPVDTQVYASEIGNTLEVTSTSVTFGGVNPYYFNGSLANVQIYNTSLTTNQVSYLYNEGIGGVPISPQYLVGWWPLNGDTNDYSGNNNNGAATAIAFNGSWTGGYNVP